MYSWAASCCDVDCTAALQLLEWTASQAGPLSPHFITGIPTIFLASPHPTLIVLRDLTPASPHRPSNV